MAAHQVEGYRVNTTLYEGPLDLLLQLIERAELDITRLALAQVTDQYLAYLRNLQETDANPAEVSGFLVIAARLVQIKSAALLPRPSIVLSDDEEEDPGEALAKQLLAYKRVKELGETLITRQEQGLHTYLRLTPPTIKVEGRLDLSDVTLADLIKAARQIFTSQPNLPALSQVVSAPRITIREKIRWMIGCLQTQAAVPFANFLKKRHDRLEVVVTFLAMLELIKRGVVIVNQIGLFGEIELNATGEWDEKDDAQLEFIE